MVKYIRDKDQLNINCPKKFGDMLGHQFIIKWDDKQKVDLVQIYFGAGNSTVTYTEA